MKYILLVLFFTLTLFGNTMHFSVSEVDEENQTIQIESPQKLDVGVSGFVVHHITPQHASVLKNVAVIGYDEVTHSALLKMSPFTILRNNALPSGKWKVQKGDTVELAFAYDRALLIAPSEEIYHNISKAVSIEWVHPDLFATILSFKGHPTPLKSDFEAMSIATNTGLLYIFLNKKLYTLDMQTFKILAINDAPFEQTKAKLPFYSRISKIEAAWFGEGSDEMQSYEPHYYELMVQHNKKNKALYEIIKEHNYTDLLTQFTLGNEK